MPDHVPTFRCRGRGDLTPGALLALWLALCAGFVTATAARPTPIAGGDRAQPTVARDAAETPAERIAAYRPDR